MRENINNDRTINGIIVKGVGGFYYVKADGGSEYECRARGLFRKERITPMIGDRVKIEESGENKGYIIKIYERSSSLVRPPVANIDTMILVAAAAEPEPNLFLMDKMLINAEISGIEPIICINKSDLCKRRDIEEIYGLAGYKVLTASAENGEGIDTLKDVLKNKVTAFAGLSGVGKSSLLSLITDERLKTGAVSEKIQRGRHTTRHVELFELDGGGYVLDTPGFGSLEVEGIEAGALCEYFPEMKNAGECRFRGCSHINEPGCAVKELVEAGKMAQSRYACYKELYEKLKQIKAWEK